MTFVVNADTRLPCTASRGRCARATLALAVVGVVNVAVAGVARGEDVSAPAILQWFEGSYSTIEQRTADIFAAGYGAVWTPPPGRADQGNFSVGYDVYDRFDLGSTNNGTLYGTETGLRNVASAFHRAGVDLHIDFVINHNGYSGTGGDIDGFRAAGDYPGFVTTLPYDVDGDFHGAFQGGDHDGRLAGLIDIDHSKNYRFIRSPVTPGDPRNIPAGTTPQFGRLADVPTETNRRFYPDQQGPSFTFDDPATGESNLTVYRFNSADPMAGDAVEENATGYLMRNAQWLVQEIGVDGFRIDAAKHVPISTLNYFDRAVFRANPRLNLDGSERRVFSYGEVFDTNRQVLRDHVRKDGFNPNVVGGNRDVLDFALQGALKDNLTGNGFQNDWHNVVNAGLDTFDDGLHNGSMGVLFVGSHDDGSGPQLNNVAHAYTLMQPGNAVVYFNGKEFGDNRNFPKDGRGDALGGRYGNAITTLLDIRNSHGRGDYQERWIEKENLAFERQGSALTLLSNRLDGGFDTRRMDVGFAWGTTLVELTGNAAADGDIPELVTVDNDFFEGPSKATVRFRRNNGGDGGYLVYGLATPRSQSGIELGGVSQTIAGGDPTSGPGSDNYRNGTTRLADVHVVTGNSFNVKLQTQAVTLTGQRLEDDQLVQRSIRDRDADGDNAVLKIDGGLDVNGNGHVDFVTPDSVVYGFEQFNTKQTGYSQASGNGTYEQDVDATNLSEGYHFVEVRAFRHRDDGGPAVYSSFKETIYVDRFKPVSGFDSFHSFGSFDGDNDVWIRSLDLTADDVRVFLNLPAGLSESQILAMVDAGQGKTDAIDRDVFKTGFFGIPNGNNAITVVTREISGNTNVQRFTGLNPASARGAGLGDLNHDGSIGADDLAGTNYGFEHFLYVRNNEFNPAADLNADGLIDNRDLFQIKTALSLTSAAQSEYRNVLLRRGNINGEFGTDQWDIDALYSRRGMSGDVWREDLDVDGAVGNADVDLLVHAILETEYGDANYDKKVDFADFAILSDHFGEAGGWALADFTGDVTVNTADFLILCDNLGFGGAAISSPEWHQMLAFADSIGVDRTLVPEPASAGPILLITAGRLLTRRRRGGVRRDRRSMAATNPTMPTAGRMTGRCDPDHSSSAGIFPRGPRPGVTLSPAVQEVQHVC